MVATYVGTTINVLDAADWIEVLADIGDVEVIKQTVDGAGFIYDLGEVKSVTKVVFDGANNWLDDADDSVVIHNSSGCEFQIDNSSLDVDFKGEYRNISLGTPGPKFNVIDCSVVDFSSFVGKDMGSGNSYCIRHLAGTITSNGSLWSTDRASISPFQFYLADGNGIKDATFALDTIDIFASTSSTVGLFNAEITTTNTTLLVDRPVFGVNTRAFAYVHLEEMTTPITTWEFRGASFESYSGVTNLIHNRASPAAHVLKLVNCNGAYMHNSTDVVVGSQTKVQQFTTYRPTIDDGTDPLETVLVVINRNDDGTDTEVLNTTTDVNGQVPEQELLIYEWNTLSGGPGRKYFTHNISLTKSEFVDDLKRSVTASFAGTTETISMIPGPDIPVALAITVTQ